MLWWTEAISQLFFSKLVCSKLPLGKYLFREYASLYDAAHSPGSLDENLSVFQWHLEAVAGIFLSYFRSAATVFLSFPYTNRHSRGPTECECSHYLYLLLVYCLSTINTIYELMVNFPFPSCRGGADKTKLNKLGFSNAENEMQN